MKVIEWQDMETRAGWCPPCAKCLSMDYGWSGSGRKSDDGTYPWVVIILLRMQSSSAAAGWSWLFSFIFFTYKTVDQGYKSQMWIKTIPSTDAVPEINPKFTVIVTKYFRKDFNWKVKVTETHLHNDWDADLGIIKGCWWKGMPKLINPCYAGRYLLGRRSAGRTCIAGNFNKFPLNLDLLTFACVHTFSA